MKLDIHPQYYETAVKCACGNHWKTGSTMPELNLEICNNCHPFYTGKEKMLDTRGRVDRLKKRMGKSDDAIKTKAPKKTRIKK
ncbi:MAG: 50S ribosomal protein L31 [Patescibacteria group bacterium]